MKKNDILKAVDTKKKGSKTTTKNKTTKKKTTPKKKTPTEKKVVKKIEEVVEPIEKEEVNEEKEIANFFPKKEKEDMEILPFKERVKRFFIKLLIFLGIFIVVFLLFYYIVEYKPKNKEKLTIDGEGFYSLNVGDTFDIMTWNIGYGALGDNADFFMDGGEMVQTATRDRVNSNLKAIRNKVEETKPSIILFQEVDKKSKRANHVNEYSSLANHFNNYSTVFAYNFKVLYLPYPIGDTIGNVNSGISTFSKYTIETAERRQLPSSFIWPVSMFNLKRCAIITRIPIKDTDKYLVVINVHLDAYDNGKGKEAQNKELLKLMNKETGKGNYVIVGGDFNQNFSSVDTSMYPVGKDVWKPGEMKVEDLGEDWQFMMDNTTPTCRSLDKPYKNADKEKFQYYVIDGFIVSRNITVNSNTTQDLGFVASDHNPVIMNVTLNS